MTKHVFLIGHPVGHSVSPVFQQAGFDWYGLDACYQAIDVDYPSLCNFVSTLRGNEVMGANVTVPHKETVIALLDVLDEDARLIGAVNTIENRGGVLVGYNTDALGFVMALKEEASFDPVGKTALILGAGGAARAVVVALASAGVESLFIANRTLVRANVLAEGVRHIIRSVETVDLYADSMSYIAKDSHIIVNCTTVGMSGSIGQKSTPIEANLIPSHALVCDLVYNPLETPMLRDAKKAGAQVLGGLPMLVYQGGASFKIWTGREAPIKIMFEAAEKAFSASRGVEN